MYEDTIVSFSHPDRISVEDPLTEVLRVGARRLLADAVEAEVSAFIAEHAELVDDSGRRRIVRHGYLPEREVQTGIGGIAVRRPRVRARAASSHAYSRQRASSAAVIHAAGYQYNWCTGKFLQPLNNDLVVLFWR